ncbi:hypothetical protein IWW45_001933 [Coemansia sp. RSA 485]|nr:hypothetical protein IWW45_001933 [Coemansia sp. RSA 485]
MSSRQTGSKVSAVMLGYSDGPIDHADDTDPLACRLGGHPLWLDETSAVPDHSSGICANCSQQMTLLVQAYVPLEDSAYDRVIYVWACNRRACAGRSGAAKVVRGHLLNKEYALKLVKRKRSAYSKDKSKPAVAVKPNGAALQLDFGSVWRTGGEEGRAEVSGDKDTAGFLSGGSLFSGPLFSGSGSGPLFGGQSASAEQQKAEEAAKEQNMEEKELADKMDMLGMSERPEEIKERVEWPDITAHVPSQYLEFDGEQLSDGQIEDRYRDQIKQAIDMAAEATGKPQKAKASASTSANDEEWSDEKYEHSTRPKGTDVGFERFARVVSQNPEQVIRYQFGGEPLLYTMQDPAAQQLGIKQSNADESDESDDDEEEELAEADSRAATKKSMLQRHGYSTKQLPRCEHCNGQRVFECQLMPALLTVLPLAENVKPLVSDSKNNTSSAADRERLVGSQLLKTVDLGLEFGTMMIFVCENDCHGGKTGTDYLGKSAASMSRFGAAAYYEELVLVQMETHLD